MMSEDLMKRSFVVVTGAAGFIGRHVVQASVAAGYQVLAVDRVAAVYPDGVISHVADLADPSALIPEGIAGSKGFILVHCAWDMRRDGGYALQVEQVRLLAGLLDEWTSRGLQRLIGLGSSEEYGARSGWIHEYDPPMMPLSPYGLAKYSAGLMVQAWSARSGISAIWLRPFLVYGPGQTGNQMLPYAVAQARKGEIAEFTDGMQERDFVYIDDLAAAIGKAIAAESKGYQVLNIGVGEPVKVREVLEYLSKQLNAERLFQYGVRPRRTGEPERQYADSSRAKELLNWRPEVGWQEGVRMMVRGS
jgi:nucleoside-diphosphate-sugar epimerase